MSSLTILKMAAQDIVAHLKTAPAGYDIPRAHIMADLKHTFSDLQARKAVEFLQGIGVIEIIDDEDVRLVGLQGGSPCAQ